MLTKSAAKSLEDLIPDLILLILIRAGDPIYLGRLMQTSKALSNKLKSIVTSRLYWQFHLERDFPRFKIRSNNSDLRQSYIEQSRLRKNTCKLDDKHRKLFNAIRSNDLERIQKLMPLILENHFLGQTDNEELDAVSLASKYGREQILEHFYKVGSSNYVQNLLDGLSKLYWAVSCGILSEVKTQLKSGATNINYLTDNGGTPLFVAAQQGHAQAIMALLRAGARINEIINGSTPLCIAAQQGHVEATKALLNAGAPIDQINNNNLSPLCLAALNGHEDVIRVLLEAGANCNGIVDCPAPLHYVIKQDLLETVRTLLNKGVNLNHLSDAGETPLHIAALHGHLEIVKILLEAGADPNYPDKIGATPLHNAALHGHLEIVIALLNAGVDPNFSDDRKATPLHHAARYGHLAITKVLLEAKANPNCRINTGATPLYIATLHGHLEIVKTLLTAGGIGNEPNNIGRTPIDIANSKNYPAIYTLLKLWQVKEALKDQSIYKQIIAILTMSTSLDRGLIKSLFFKLPGESQLPEIMNHLHKIQTIFNIESEEIVFKQFLEDQRSKIPSEKFEFIMTFILRNKPEGLKEHASNGLYEIKLNDAYGLDFADTQSRF